MAERITGILTKIVIHPQSTHSEREEIEVVSVDELGDPDTSDEQTELLDGFLIGNDRGADGSRPDLSPMERSATPLIIDIDDGTVDAPTRLGALKRVSSAPRTMSKFNRHTGSWE